MRAIFIVGTGRSGTHFTTRLLNGFEHTNDPMKGKEDPNLLMDIANAAIHHRLPSRNSERVYRHRIMHEDGVFLDQHHPNLFFVNHWSTLFEGVVFLYPQRPIYQTVASMLRHRGVMSWYRYAKGWRQRTINRIPYPNRFLGLEQFSDVQSLPPHLLCAHRVIAHQKAYEGSVAMMNGALRSIDYVSLVNNPLEEFSRVFSAKEITRLGKFSLVEQPSPQSLSKYKDVLSEKEVAEINALGRTLYG